MNTIQQNQVQVTKKGLESLKKELSLLKDKKRPQVVDRLSFARSQGDLSENSDYHNAKDELEFLDGRISELEEVLSNAVVVAKNGDSSHVGVGVSVTVKANGAENTFHIVGEWEADPMKKKISHTSPLGQALVGKKVGEEVEVEAPAGKINYEIISIE